ncbi:MAG TPA: hypothetical protein DCQ98_17210 [Planctomycetaceae bacterium]|nr:hypothetical protein [Planctomycetaceae bacterium]HRF02284.1 prepilin-type N-terminal cleavage/methylation domain-containing protein [Pirellulaceae bacterium]
MTAVRLAEPGSVSGVDLLQTAESACLVSAELSRTKSRRSGGVRRGLTLTEILIAVTVTLVLMAALVNAFAAINDEISSSRAVLELAGQLRGSSETIREDLRGVTVPVGPWVDPSEGLGYFEYAEFATAGTGVNPRNLPIAGVNFSTYHERADNLVGDLDDVVMFTCRSNGKPFRGRLRVPGGTRMIESPLAEIAIWTRLNDVDGDGVLNRTIGEYVVVYRRVLLIRPDLNDAATGRIAPTNDLLAWYQNNDVSVHASANGLVANSLGELSKREHRFAHFIGAAPGTVPADIDPNAFPYPIDRLWLNSLILTGNFRGEDVLLSDAIAFDIKAFDPSAPVYNGSHLTGNPSLPVTQGDPFFEALVAADFANDATYGFQPSPSPRDFDSRGSYVDLGYAHFLGESIGTPAFRTFVDGLSDFSGAPTVKSQMGSLLPRTRFSPLVYDTWPLHYESDGLNQDAATDNDGSGAPTTALVDEGTNGIDDPNDSLALALAFPIPPVNAATNAIPRLGPDDAYERETSPPFVPTLRGIEVTLRVIEPQSQQARQTSIVVDF